MNDATPITAAMLAEWRATTEAATPGPWHAVRIADEWRILDGPQYDAGNFLDRDVYGRADINAAFIATAREAMPLLIAEVERLRDRNEELSEAFDEVVAESNSAVQVAREGRDAAHAMAAERVQTEMARLRAELSRERAGVRQRDATIMELRNELNRSLPQ